MKDIGIENRRKEGKKWAVEVDFEVENVDAILTKKATQIIVKTLVMAQSKHRSHSQCHYEGQSKT